MLIYAKLNYTCDKLALICVLTTANFTFEPLYYFINGQLPTNKPVSHYPPIRCFPENRYKLLHGWQ